MNKDLTNKFRDLWDARRDVSIFSGCTDGSEGFALDVYQNRLKNFTSEIEGHVWKCTIDSKEFVGKSYDEEVFKTMFRDMEYRSNVLFLIME